MFRIDEAGYAIKDYKDIAAMSRHNGDKAIYNVKSISENMSDSNFMEQNRISDE